MWEGARGGGARGGICSVLQSIRWGDGSGKQSERACFSRVGVWPHCPFPWTEKTAPRRRLFLSSHVSFTALFAPSSVFLAHLGIATVDFEFQQDPAAEYGVCECNYCRHGSIVVGCDDNGQRCGEDGSRSACVVCRQLKLLSTSKKEQAANEGAPHQSYTSEAFFRGKVAFVFGLRLRLCCFLLSLCQDFV